LELIIGQKDYNYAQQGFCVRRAEVQNSTAVFQLNFGNNIGFCASISRPNAKPRTVVQKARCASLLYNALRLHHSCTKFSLRSPFVQLRFCKIPKNNLASLNCFSELRKAAAR
jgi:hypothetical protein